MNPKATPEPFKKYFEFYTNENIKSTEIRTFMYCGDNIPTECFCGCGSKRLFSEEMQNKNYEKLNKYRFFNNEVHIKRFKILN